MSDRLPRVLVALGLLITGGLATWFTIRELSVERLEAPHGTIVIERVVTPEARERGLSGRSSLDADAGMLFVFDQPSTRHCLWMKDMKIALDMVWLDEGKKVINVARDVKPESYPETFCPEAEAVYALELNAGAANSLGIEPGRSLDFR